MSEAIKTKFPARGIHGTSGTDATPRGNEYQILFVGSFRILLALE
jgi:hypothetical protein